MSHGTGEASVVFVVGPAHTGKTEVAIALRDEGDTVVVRRAYFWRDEYARSGPLSNEESLARCLDRLEGDDFLRSTGIGRDDLARFAESGDHTYGHLFAQATAEAARRSADSQGDPHRLVIQIGGLERMATAVSRDLPDAHFIHTIRDPRGYFGEFSGTAGRLGWRLASWSSSAAAALRNSTAIPERYLVVRGEDLIEAPERVAVSISSRLGGQVRFDGASGSLAAKGRALPKRRASIVERLVGRQLEALGYPVDDMVGGTSRSSGALDAGMYHLRSRIGLRLGALT